jgi:hypothetical protein
MRAGFRFDVALQLPCELTANDRDVIYERSFMHPNES